MTFEAEVSGLRVIDVEYPPQTDFDTHTHEEAYALLVVRGSYVEWRPGKRTVHRGSDQLWCAGSRHAVRTGSEAVRILHVADPTDACSRAARPLRTRILWQIAWSLGSEGEVVSDPDRRLHVESLVAELDAAEAPEAVPQSPHTRSREHWLDLVRKRLREGYRDQPSLGELASIVERHPTHLVRAFRDRWGLTPGEYVRRVRVAEAIRMLQKDDMPLSAVAFAAGFSDQSHMGRWIRRYTGMTPGRLRELR